ncbi:hypothetical protein, partial [uncultured Holdemanella sp.]|uniref:hypothetical protein n=1 Tax=uncultured Holdemanella sp. TaxID=1763549 RepID=UPI0025EA2999
KFDIKKALHKRHLEYLRFYNCRTTDLKNRLNDKLNYITKIKGQRNKAQDELSEIRKILELSDDISLREYILNLKSSIDKE